MPFFYPSDVFDTVLVEVNHISVIPRKYKGSIVFFSGHILACFFHRVLKVYKYKTNFLSEDSNLNGGSLVF